MKFTLNNIERRLILFIGDLLMIIFYIRLLVDYILRGTYDSQNDIFIFIFGMPLFFVIAYIMDIYNLERSTTTRSIIPVSFITMSSYSVILFLSVVFLFNTTVSRPFLILYFIIPFVFVLWRILVVRVFSLHPFFKKTLYIHDDKVNKVKYRINLIEGNDFSNGYKVKLKLSTSDDDRIFKKKILNNALNQIDTIILDVEDYTLVSKELENYIIKAMLLGKEVRTFLNYYEKMYEAIPIELNKTTFYDSLEFKNHKWAYLQVLFSKIIDFFLCLFVGIVFIFVTPFVYILNLFFNKGPLFYTQRRVGKRGEEFDVYKFRSMVTNAEKQGAKMAVKNDSRITPFGKILRKFRIDELPQIISVIKGDMSFIGPRPERKVFVDQLNKMTPFYNVRHLVKPGITGWAQVKYKYGENLEDSINKLEYDLYYIKNRSITLDIRIIFKTVTTVLFSRGV